MTGWVLAAGLALAAFVLAAFVLKLPRRGWEALGAALLLGIAGYALQGSPDQPGASKTAVAATRSGEGLVAARQTLADSSAPGSNLMIVAEGMLRNGQYGTAAGVLRGAVQRNPNDGEAWLTLANALVGHAEGNLSPAALLAYREAARVAPDHPGPPFFLGLAFAQSGRLNEARALWADLLARTPADAPWRADLVERLAQLDRFIAEQGGEPTR
ncbi:MAG: tetratricopeptide repeat protein [Novosphingobium sp.]